MARLPRRSRSGGLPLLALGFFAAAALPVGAESPTDPAASRPRLFVLTDIGGDPDDGSRTSDRGQVQGGAGAADSRFKI
jgi:hypothetical protein